MLEALDASVATAQDDLLRDPIPVAHKELLERGRSRIEIDVNWLRHASQGMTLKDIAVEVGCSARTVRRRMLEHHLAEPAPPVIRTVVQPNGMITKEWHPTGPTRFDFKDNPEELEDHVRAILRRFKDYSPRYVNGALRSQGYKVAREDIRASLRNVRGVQARFVNRPIERRVYSVPEVNSLWHHDGNHSKRDLQCLRSHC
jgi:hypothetical protein